MQRFSLDITSLAARGQYRTRNQSNGTWGAWVNHNGPYPTSIRKGWTYGYDTPDVHALRRKGKLIPMTLYRRLDKVIDPLLFAVEYRNSTAVYNPTYETNLYEQCRYSDVTDEYLEQQLDRDLGLYLVQEAAADAYTRGWDGLTFVAEYHKTRKMVLGLARNLRSLYDRVMKLLFERRSDLSFAGLLALKLKQARALKLEDVWLEARYGWRILIYDIEDVYKLLTNLGKQTNRVRSKSLDGSSSTETSTTTVAWGTQGNESYTTTTSLSVQHIGRLVADFSPPKVRVNIPLTAWELVKFSWVVDWFFHVGQWLEALSFLGMQSSYTSAWGCAVKVSRQVTHPVFTPIGSKSIVLTSHKGSGLTTATYLVRNPCQVSILPQWRVDLNLGRIIDALALILQFTRRR